MAIEAAASAPITAPLLEAVTVASTNRFIQSHSALKTRAQASSNPASHEALLLGVTVAGGVPGVRAVGLVDA
jgi:hypothetical protein